MLGAKRLGVANEKRNGKFIKSLVTKGGTTLDNKKKKKHFRTNN